MTQPVNIEGVGIVEFEDGMTPQEIEAAIVNDILPKFQSQQTQQEKDPLAGDDSALRRVSDVGIDLLKGGLGVVDAVTGLADIPTGGRVGKFTDEISEQIFGGTTEDAKEFLDKGTSRQGLRAEREVAEAEGFGGTLSAMLQNPSTIIGTVAESLPAMFGGAKIAQGLVKLNKFQKAAKTGKAGRPKKVADYATAAGIGEGTVGAGMQATDIRRQTDDQTLSVGQSGLSALTGVFTGILGTFGGRIAQRYGLLDPDIFLAQTVTESTKRGMINNAIRSGIAEGFLEELPQSFQEQVLQNIALGKDPLEGWGEAAATGLLAGFGAGGGFAAFSQPRRRRKAIDEEAMQQALDDKKPKGDPEVGPPPPDVQSQIPILSDPQVTPEVKPKAKPKVKPIKQVDDSDYDIDVDYEQNKLPNEDLQAFAIRRKAERTEAENQGEPVYEEIQSTTEEERGTPLTQASTKLPITPTIAPRVGGGPAVSEPGRFNQTDTQTPVATDGGGLDTGTDTIGGTVTTEGEQQPALKKEELTQEEKNKTFEQEYNKQSKEQFELRKSKGQEYVKANKLNLHPFEISGSKYAGSSPLQSIKTNQKTKDSKIIFDPKPNIEQIRKKAFIDANYVIALKDVESADTSAISKEVGALQTATNNKARKEYNKKFTAFKKLKENKSLDKRTLRTRFNKKFPNLKPKDQNKKINGENVKVKTFPQALQTKEYENEVRKIYEKYEGKLELKELDIELQEDINRAQEYINSLDSTSQLLSDREIEENKNKIRNRLITRVINKRDRIGTLDLTAKKDDKVEKDLEDIDIQELGFRTTKRDTGQSPEDIQLDKKAEQNIKETELTETDRKKAAFIQIANELLDGEGNPNPPINLKTILDILTSLAGVDGRIAQKLSNINSNTKIQVGQIENNEKGKFDPDTNTITINIEALFETSGTAIDAVNTVLHETMHSALDHVIDTTARYNYLKRRETNKKITTAEKAELKVINKNLTESQRNSVKKLKTYQTKLRKYYKDTNQSLPNGLKEGQDLNEFIAYIFEGETAKESLGVGESFQKVLSNLSQMEVGVKLENESMLDRLKNIYGDLKNTIMGALGLNKKDNFSMLRAISAEVDIILNPRTYSPAVTTTEADLGLGIAAKTTRFRERGERKRDKDKTPEEIKESREKSAAIAKSKSKKPGESKYQKDRKAAKDLEAQKSPDKIIEDKSKKQQQNIPKSHLSRIIKGLSDSSYWRQMFQNARAVLVELESGLRKSGELIIGKEGFNNLNSLLDLAFGQSDFLYRRELQEKLNTYKRAIAEYITAQKEKGKTDAEAMSQLHVYLEALHEPERRHIRFIKNVPLDETINLEWTDKNGKSEMVSANEFRRRILEELSSNETLTKADINAHRGNLEFIVQNYADINGGVPSNAKIGIKGNPEALNEQSQLYDVTASSHITQQKLRDQLNRRPQEKESVEKIQALMQPIHKSTLALNKMADFNTNVSQNLIDFYGFENYIPLKGEVKRDSQGEIIKEDATYDADFDYTGERLSAELRQIPQGFDSRDSESSNGVTQTIVDAIQSTARAGRKDITQAIINLIDQGHIKGKVGPKLPLSERYLGIEEIGQEKLSPNAIVHNNPDGSIQIISIDTTSKMGERLLRAIRPPIKDANILTETMALMNNATSFIGQTHTRYNPAFPFLNFIRDAITNFFIIAVENPAALPRYTTEIARQLVGGVGKTKKAINKFVDGDIKGLEAYAKKQGPDSIAQDLLDFLKKGGNVSYIQSLATSTQLEEILENANKGPGGYIIETKDGIKTVFDKVVNTFELAVRLAAYRAIRNQRKSNGLSEEEAIEDATAYAKNLANFEQTGEWGKEMGALYMFFRPGATGAVRALDAISPALRTLTSPLGLSGGIKTLRNRLPDSIKNDPAKLAVWEKQINKDIALGSIVIAATMGLGAVSYYMAKSLSGDDDEDRNIIDSDDMARSTRFLRLDFGDGEIVQIPWGFGLGGLAAIGAQLSAMKSSTWQENPQQLRNIFEITLDSFLPIPISRIDFTQPGIQPKGDFLLDTVTPSIIRPYVQLNKNLSGFGYQVFRTNNRYGQSYTGGDNTPQIYKDAAMWLSDLTNAESQISPDALYFLSNNYFDGPGRVLHSLYEGNLILKGEKAATLDNVSKATMVFDSLVSKATEITPKDWGAFENVIEKKRRQFDTLNLSDNKAGLNKFLAEPENAGIEEVIGLYNTRKGGYLQSLQSELQAIRLNKSISLKERNKQIERKKDEVNSEKRAIMKEIERMNPNVAPFQGINKKGERVPL
tara:strand:- start:1765 stop:8601 length:6837 start_codon:yes stop_codon:yes gene_type:complete